jgi:hemoglobin
MADLYQTIGGEETCRKLATAFYARVERDPVLRPFFPSTFRCAIEAFAAFLAQFLGGPPEDAQRRFWLSLRESHLRFKIGPKEREAWMNNMVQALDDIQIEETTRGALSCFFEQSSAYLVNQGIAVPENRSQAPGSGIHQEIAQRWEMQLTVDKAVAAVRTGDAVRAVALAEEVKSQRSVFASLLALMMAS